MQCLHRPSVHWMLSSAKQLLRWEIPTKVEHVAHLWLDLVTPSLDLSRLDLKPRYALKGVSPPKGRKGPRANRGMKEWPWGREKIDSTVLLLVRRSAPTRPISPVCWVLSTSTLQVHLQSLAVRLVRVGHFGASPIGDVKRGDFACYSCSLCHSCDVWVLCVLCTRCVAC